MKVRIDIEEWQFIGQLMIDILNNQFPQQLILECATLAEWHRAETGKFTYPKTRQQQFKLPVFISLVRVLNAVPERWEDPYWQTIKINLVDKLNQVGN